MKKTSDVYEKLYHYTTWDALLQILQKQTLWATHYRFLSDYSEIVLFRDKLVRWILPHVRKKYESIIKEDPGVQQIITKKGGLNQVIQHDAEVLVDTKYKALGDEIYILSFCGQHRDPYVNNNGLLSQWRGYGADGGAVLAFNTKKLEEILAVEEQRFEYSMMHVSDVIYSDDEDRLKEELSEDLDTLTDEVPQLFSSPREEIDARKLYYSFVSCITRYKHRGFSEENEVRVVALPVILTQELLTRATAQGVTLKPEKVRQFRSKNGQYVPYIEFFNSADIELPIERIIVGPHKEKENRASALRVLLRRTGIEVTCSDIPFNG